MKRVGSTRRKRALRCRYVDEKSREVLPESLAEARGAVEALIAAEGGGRDVFVGGFSQGGMVAVDVAMNCAVRGAFSLNGMALSCTRTTSSHQT